MRAHLLPNEEPLTFIHPDGSWHDCAELEAPTSAQLRQLYRGMVIGRRFDAQATALVKQGRLAVYPSAHGQDACQVAAAQVLGDQDWLFPTYRDSMAVISRGVDPIEVLALLRKPDAAKADVDVRYVGFDIPDEFVVGYGLDHAERYRDLPFVGLLKPEAYAPR